MSTIGSITTAVLITSYEQLDAMIGRYVMEQAPEVHWEHTITHWRFDSLNDALDALNDPFFAGLVPEIARPSLGVTEVREYPPYSSELAFAMKVVEMMGSERRPLTLSPKEPGWAAAFGEEDGVTAPTPALAICLAALRRRGLEVELGREQVWDRKAA